MKVYEILPSAIPDPNQKTISIGTYTNFVLDFYDPSTNNIEVLIDIFYYNYNPINGLFVSNSNKKICDINFVQDFHAVFHTDRDIYNPINVLNRFSLEEDRNLNLSDISFDTTSVVVTY